MPIWKLKLLLVAAAWMLIGGTCTAQGGQDAPVGFPANPASGAMRGGSPTPFMAPVAVPSAAGQIQPLTLPTPTITITPAPAPRFSSTCDSSGCWGSDGTRYNAIGGALVRPDGRRCENVGGTISCP